MHATGPESLSQLPRFPGEKINQSIDHGFMAPSILHFPQGDDAITQSAHRSSSSWLGYMTRRPFEVSSADLASFYLGWMPDALLLRNTRKLGLPFITTLSITCCVLL